MSHPASDNSVRTPAPQTAPAAAPPSTNGGNGRDGRWRFTAGNRGGPGNPFARQTAALRRSLLAVVTPEDLEAIARMLVAVKLLLLYVIGRPAEAVDPDTLDVQEWHLFQQSQASAEQVQAALGGLPLELACPVVRATRGPIADATAAQLAQALKQEPTPPQTEVGEDPAAPAAARAISQEGQTQEPASPTGRQAARGTPSPTPSVTTTARPGGKAGCSAPSPPLRERRAGGEAAALSPASRSAALPPLSPEAGETGERGGRRAG
jgi:hypothetical protein